MKILQIIMQRRLVVGILLLILIGFIVWVVISANSTPDDHRWLMKQPCAAPCWEGITPGFTTAEDTFKLLQQNQLFSDVEVFSPKSRLKESSVGWNWRWTNIGGEADFDGSSATHTIQRIAINLPHPTKLKDVIDVFGYPSDVIVSAETGSDMSDRRIGYGVELYYIQSGFYIHIVKSGEAGFIKPTIYPETTFNYIVFFAASIDGLSMALHRDKDILQNQLIPWQQNMFDFDVYCKLQYKSEAIYHCE